MSNNSSLNHNYFENITESSAYILGFFTADGDMSINNRGSRYISFTSTDREIIEWIKYQLNAHQKVGVRDRRRNHPNWKVSYRLQIGSKELYRSIGKYGLTPNKSKTIILPDIPNRYFRDFARGYFDGDGYSSYGSYRKKRDNHKTKHLFSGFISGSKIFLQQFKSRLSCLAEINGGTLYFQNGYRLAFSSRDSLKLFQFIYQNKSKSFFLSRKYCHFQSCLNQYFGPVV